MNNKKGQALVEFILVLPILIFIILAFIDIARIMIMKNHLEGVIGDINIDTKKIEDKEYEIEFKRLEDENSVSIELKSCLEVTTPGLNKILGDPACVTTSKIMEKVEKE